MFSCSGQQAEASFGTDDAFGLCCEDVATGQRYTTRSGQRAGQGEPADLPGAGHRVSRRGQRHGVHPLRASGGCSPPGPGPALRVLRAGQPDRAHGLAVGGHDFAVVDDRFIVDPWIRLVEGMAELICFDLHDPGAATTADLFGDRSPWEEATRP